MISISTVKKSIYGATTAITFVGVKALAAPLSKTAQQGVNSITPDNTQNSLPDLLTLIINTFIGLIGIAAVIMLLVGSFRYIFSQGDEKAITSAKGTITAAVIGVVLALVSFAIVNYVLNQVGTT